jgi:putative tricarboxylic transport membrane protein
MMPAMHTLRSFFAAALIAALLAAAIPAAAADAECVVPSKPGGAMDLTCKLARKALQARPDAPGR